MALLQYISIIFTLQPGDALVMRLETTEFRSCVAA